ncbi:protein phosphatase inhibitor 2-like isoform X2 [Narcine bancroftii]|uniref:protein phosphatase inhibitor 2-like isoform X2 n=1 Tax=Narcine bancroftii TaxID=1343680 RepID=UPI0038310497
MPCGFWIPRELGGKARSALARAVSGRRSGSVLEARSRSTNTTSAMAAPVPLKGILKNRTPAQYQRNSALDLSVEDEEEYNKKTQKWDEMNILATYHPEGKDYGLMKIDEPSTPYNRIVGGDDDEAAMSDSESNVNVTAEILAQKLSAAEGINPKIFEPKEETSEEEEEEELTPEEQENKKQFEMKRKMHYNEGMNIKLARQLIAKELEDAEDEDDSKSPEELENFEDGITLVNLHWILPLLSENPTAPFLLFLRHLLFYFFFNQLDC